MQRFAHFLQRTALACATLALGALSCSGSPEAPSTPTQLVLTTVAAGAASGAPFTTQPTVTLRDAANSTVLTDNSSLVTMAVSAGASVVGTATAQALAGVATFTGLGISGVSGVNYTLTFSRSGVTSATQSISLSTGSSSQLVLVTNAAGSANGTAFTTQPIVAIKDGSGNTVTSDGATVVTMTVSTGGTVIGTATATASSGLATFSTVGISGTAGATYTLTFAKSGLTSVTQTIVPTAGAATQLSLSTSAAGAASGAAFTTQPAATVRDAAGNTVTTNTSTITMTVSGNGVVVGTAAKVAANGVAIFSGVGISGTAGASYTLTFGSGTLASATQSIIPTAGAVATVTLSASLVSLTALQTQQLTAQMRDGFGNIVSGSTATWTSSNAAVATISSSGLVTAVAVGTATLTATSNGQSATATITVPTLIFSALAAGALHSCALTTVGGAYCWGYGGNGQIGDAALSTRQTPVAVAGGLAFATLASGANHVCGVTSVGAAYCWGSNGYGVGDGTTTQRLSPVAVSGGLAFASLSAADYHTCGVTTAGAAYCWGNNSHGQLGNGTTNDSQSPVAVLNGLTFSAVTAGFQHTCGLTTAGAAYCWGYNGGDGRLGDGDANGTHRQTPVAVSGGIAFTVLTAGANHTCGLTSAGKAYCWGNNTFGPIGDGTTTHRQTPVAVQGGLVFNSLTAGDDHTCGVTSTGTAHCWGLNDAGQLGDGTITNRPAPVAVLGGVGFASVKAGGTRHTCGLAIGGTAYCWGANGSGQLGDGTLTTRTSPAAVSKP